MKNELKLLLPKISQLKICRESDTYGAKWALGERVKIFLGKQSSVYLHLEKNKMLKPHDHFD